jgi:hypothetical protein
MRIVEVFKTNVISKLAARAILVEIGTHQPEYKCNFDLEDCDKVLRIENASGRVDVNLVMEILGAKNYQCEILE